jgi:hypothetical protein
MTCEVCGNVGHLGNDCEKPKEKQCTLTATTTMGFFHKEVRGGINQVHISRR